MSDPDFVPFIWRRKGDDTDDDGGAKEKDDDMDTLDNSGNPSKQPSSNAAPTNDTHANMVSRGAPGGNSMIFAVTPFNSSPQAPRGMELATS